MIRVNIQSDSRYSVDRKRIREAVNQCLSMQGVVGDNMWVGVHVVGDRKMEELNKKYMKKSGTTDVLSFPMIDGESGFVEPETEEVCLGEVVVSFPQAVKQAMELNHSVDEEIAMLVQHGLLHLLGVHHD